MLKKNFKILLFSILISQLASAQKDSINFKISSNYLDGIPYLMKSRTVENYGSQIDVYFFKKYFAEFYGLPMELIKKEFKNQEVTEWEFKNKPKELLENWRETYKYDSEGKLIEYKYSGCTICSQLAWGFILIYDKRDRIVEQQRYFLEQKIYVDENGLKVKFEPKDEMTSRIRLTYDKNGNITLFEKSGKNGLEESIELIK